MPLINCDINLILTLASTFVITISIGAGTFTLTNAKLYVPVVIFSTQDNVKLLNQLKSGLKRTFNWNKYHSRASIEGQKERFTCYSLLVTFKSLLVTRYFLLVTRYYLLVTSCFLLITCYFLLVTRYFSLPTTYLLLVINFSLLFSCYSLLFTCCLLIFIRY